MIDKKNGEQSSLAEEHKSRVDKMLQDYKNSLNLPTYKKESKVDFYLNIEAGKIKKLSRDENAEAAVILSRFAMFLQSEQNTQKSTIDWAESLINITIADQVDQYQGYSYQERKMKAIKANDYTRKLYQIQGVARAKLNTIDFLSTRVSFHSKIYSGIMGVRNG